MPVEVAGLRGFGVHQQSAAADLPAHGGGAGDHVLQQGGAQPPAFVVLTHSKASQQGDRLGVASRSPAQSWRRGCYGDGGPGGSRTSVADKRNDPVQAMDPGKVDGLACVLSTVAQERQVVVFTHDERLSGVGSPFADSGARHRSGAPPGLAGGVPHHDPVSQYLSDARALVHTDGLPAGAAARAVPLFCRMAMEAACADSFRRRRIGGGEPHTDTDEMLNAARTLMAKLALALFDDAVRTGAVPGRINRSVRGWADAVRWANSGTHGAGGAAADLPPVVSATERLARWLSRRP